MLKRCQRIQGRSKVQALIKEGDSRMNPFFVLKKQVNDGKRNRYAIALSKKIEKSAVKRNHKRRQIYEIIRFLEKESRVANEPSFDIVLIARHRVMTASFQELSKQVHSLLLSLS